MEPKEFKVNEEKGSQCEYQYQNDDDVRIMTRILKEP